MSASAQKSAAESARKPQEAASGFRHGESSHGAVAAQQGASSSAENLLISADGGAVLLQDPDGTQHFVLLVSDLKRLADAQKQGREPESSGLHTYTVGLLVCPRGDVWTVVNGGISACCCVCGIVPGHALV